ncbi:hypothetical protein [Hymenobacter sp. DG25A]|uniref:hypothetical protein n=1 Tax=Hymenobacter sp. DG25A TaxID=1385663 RepID=UPI000AAA26D8|nr:hypothetical protein [Hymenobacter sp. DG25A]
MLRNLLLPLLFLTTASVAAAQAGGCPKPVLKVLRNGVEIPATGSAMAPGIRLQITSDPECREKVSYRVTAAEITLVRGGRPLLPTLLVKQPQADLRGFMPHSRSGDYVYVFIPYKNLRVVSADGTLQPYLPPASAKSESRQRDVTPDAAQGIVFKWILL